MNEDASHPGTSDEPTEALNAIPSTVAAGFCPKCTYDLQGLAVKGECPECGEKYEADMLSPSPLPGAFSICLRFLWPLAVLVVFSIVFFSMAPRHPYFVIEWMLYSMIGLVILIFNGVMQGYHLVKQQSAMGFEEQPFDDQLSRIGTIALVLFYLTVALPIVIIGGLLVLTLSALV